MRRLAGLGPRTAASSQLMSVPVLPLSSVPGGGGGGHHQVIGIATTTTTAMMAFNTTAAATTPPVSSIPMPNLDYLFSPSASAPTAAKPRSSPRTKASAAEKKKKKEGAKEQRSEQSLTSSSSSSSTPLFHNVPKGATIEQVKSIMLGGRQPSTGTGSIADDEQHNIPVMTTAVESPPQIESENEEELPRKRRGFFVSPYTKGAPLTVYGTPHESLSAFLMRRQAIKRHFSSHFDIWLSEHQAARLGTRIREKEKDHGVKVMFQDRQVISFYNILQTEDRKAIYRGLNQYTVGRRIQEEEEEEGDASKKSVGEVERQGRKRPPLKVIPVGVVGKGESSSNPKAQQFGKPTKLGRSSSASASSSPPSTFLPGRTPESPSLRDPKEGFVASEEQKAKIEALLEEERQKDSAFQTNERRKAEQRQHKIDSLVAKSEAFLGNPHHRTKSTGSAVSTKQRQQLARRCDECIKVVSQRFQEHKGIYLHLDMDMFYCAVEQRDDPVLRSLPFAVGDRMMLATSNYEARKYGVRSGMPGYLAHKLCPDLVILPPRMELYREVSLIVKTVVAQYDPQFMSGGWDEMTLNIGPYLKRANPLLISGGGMAMASGSSGTCSDAAAAAGTEGKRKEKQHQGEDFWLQRKQWTVSPADVALRIRNEIFEATQGLTSSVGIAVTPVMAKLMASKNKPNGQFVLNEVATMGALLKFLSDVPARKIPGIGPSTEEALKALGITSLGDIFADRKRLCYVFTPKTFEFLLASSMGVSTIMAQRSGGFDTTTSSSTALLPLPPAATTAVISGSDEQPTTTSLVPCDDEKRSDLQAAGTTDLTTTEARQKKENRAGGRKSVSVSKTFPVAIASPVTLEAFVRAMAHDCVRQIQLEHYLCKQVTLTVKYRSFVVKQRSTRLSQHTDDEQLIKAALKQLLQPFSSKKREYSELRLAGVALSGLQPSQPSSELSLHQEVPVSVLASSPSAINNISNSTNTNTNTSNVLALPEQLLNELAGGTPNLGLNLSPTGTSPRSISSYNQEGRKRSGSIPRTEVGGKKEKKTPKGKEDPSQENNNNNNLSTTGRRAIGLLDISLAAGGAGQSKKKMGTTTTRVVSLSSAEARSLRRSAKNNKQPQCLPDAPRADTSSVLVDQLLGQGLPQGLLENLLE